MLNQIMTIVISVLFCGTLVVSVNPAASVEEQRHAISLPDNFRLPNSLCMSMLCFRPCLCSSYRDHRGCDTCNCRPYDGSGCGDDLGNSLISILIE
ncbi:unnamed protein product [Rotaria sp. Silwood2]|nr:unnamed protein product [Rotaria sp. Silwood2]CAF2843519.1 unnamed protein product [Rotaria sp. Silwood2]CAF3230095.1 unnamed protein product [Rotaria sp. Silwood2]CAF3323633.1 unnamed protein product [Rotaria sp. Silwood2]CAF4089799.1 unnamed protein product [Rotaria sp. Silwood2]